MQSHRLKRPSAYYAPHRDSNNKMHYYGKFLEDLASPQSGEGTKQKGGQRCYQCKAMVELKEGCNHVTCRCTAEFCMVCGQKWKSCDCPWFNYEHVDGHLDNPTRSREEQQARDERQAQRMKTLSTDDNDDEIISSSAGGAVGHSANDEFLKQARDILTGNMRHARKPNSETTRVSSRKPKDVNQAIYFSQEQGYEEQSERPRRRPTSTKRATKGPPKATKEDAVKAGIPTGYSIKNWDPEELPIILLGSVFDANSLGKWIYDWTVFHHGPATPMADVAGDLWLLLIQLAGKIMRAEAIVPRIRDTDSQEMVEEFIQSGDRLVKKFKQLLKSCETFMLKAAKNEGSKGMGKKAGTEFVDTMFGKDRELENTEKLMSSIRLWSMRFDTNCEEILRRPSAGSVTSDVPTRSGPGMTATQQVELAPNYYRRNTTLDASKDPAEKVPIPESAGDGADEDWIESLEKFAKKSKKKSKDNHKIAQTSMWASPEDETAPAPVAAEAEPPTAKDTPDMAEHDELVVRPTEELQVERLVPGFTSP